MLACLRPRSANGQPGDFSRAPRGPASDSSSGRPWCAGALLIFVIAACNATGTQPAPRGVASPPPAIPAAATSLASPAGSAAVSTPTPAPLPDILARHLRIPSLGLDAEVQLSELVPVSSEAGDGGGSAPGCVSAPATGSSLEPAPRAAGSAVAGPSPPPPAEARTFRVPAQGIATPADAFDHLRHRSWIFGHSRWQGAPGLLFALQRIELGDELFVDGVDRLSGMPIDGARFVVTGIYLSDTDDGAALVAGDRIGPRSVPLVVLQTSVRESGANRPWILDRETLLAKAETVMEGELDNPCKYLLLFVVAEYAP